MVGGAVLLRGLEFTEMVSAKEFVEFWLQNSVHADEPFATRRGKAGVAHLVQNLLAAAKAQGFTKEQMEAELGGDLDAYIRASIDRQNRGETARLRNDKP
jgi:hypothetical protein